MTTNGYRSVEESRLAPLPVLDTIIASSPASTTKEPSSRVLKKRESDRRCQRIKRERTKSKIAALEETVRNLGNEDATGQIQFLVKQLQDVQRERDGLAKKVTIIESVIQEGREDKQTRVDEYSTSQCISPSTASQLGQGHADVDIRAPPGQRKFEAFPLNLPSADSTGRQAQPPMAQHSVSPFDAISSMSGTQESFVAEVAPASEPSNRPMPLLSTAQCECCTVETSPTKRPRFNTWRFVNEVLSSRFDWPDYCRLLDDEHRGDIPVRAVIQGWDDVSASGPVHPSWQILKKIDQTVLGKCRPKERIAVITAVQVLLLSHVKAEPVPGVPQFYEKRPSQDMANSYAIHFFPWPGMRERFVFFQHRYCTNEFWDSFIRGLTLLWPYELRDCYTKNVETGLYGISPLFLEHINNIDCWAMDTDVFQRWPELSADIPAYNRIPRSVPNWVRKPRRAENIALQTAQSCSSQLVRSRVPATQRFQSAQEFIEPTAVAGPMYYTSQPLFYNPNEKSMPVMSWMEDDMHQTMNSLDYVDPMVNPVNVTPTF